MMARICTSLIPVGTQMMTRGGIHTRPQARRMKYLSIWSVTSY